MSRRVWEVRISHVDANHFRDLILDDEEFEILSKAITRIELKRKKNHDKQLRLSIKAIKKWPKWKREALGITSDEIRLS